MDKVLASNEKRDVRKAQITLLVETYYKKFEFLRYEPLSSLVGNALDLYLDSELSLDEVNDKMIESIMERKKMNDEKYSDDAILENHERIYGRLEQVVRELNAAGIDYQLAGSLCAYLKYGAEASRCHDDIDFSLNEQDIERFRDICGKLGLAFEDNRLSSPKTLVDEVTMGEHEVVARDRESDLHIGVFPFERLETGGVVCKSYYRDNEGDACVREVIYSPEIAREAFGHEEVNFRGIPVVITPPEYVYMLKQHTNNEKDKMDIAFMDERIDREKLDRMNALVTEGRVVQNIPVDGLPDVGVKNTYSTGNGDLDEMFYDYTTSNNLGETEVMSSQKSDAKVYVKKQDTPVPAISSGENEGGFINNAIITTMIAITFTLCTIGVIIGYLILG